MKAARLLSEAEVIVFDDLGTQVTAFLINSTPRGPAVAQYEEARSHKHPDKAGCGAQAAVDEYAPAAAELCFVGKRGGAKSARQEEINELLVHHCLQVAALCLKVLLCALSG